MTDTPAPRRHVAKAPLGARIIRAVSLVIAIVGAIVGILIFLGRNALPECDSSRARQTLTSIFRENGVAHGGFDEMRQTSRGESEIACAAVVSLTDGGKIDVTYRILRENDRNLVRASWTRRGG